MPSIAWPLQSGGTWKANFVDFADYAIIAVITAGFALLNNLFLNLFQRRQRHSDTVRMIRAELLNLERHCQEARLQLEADRPLSPVQILFAKLPEGGLVSLETTNLLGVSDLLCRDLMALVIFLRNTNVLIDRAVEVPASAAVLTALRERLQSADRDAHSVRRAMQDNWLTGGATYGEVLMVTRAHKDDPAALSALGADKSMTAAAVRREREPGFSEDPPWNTYFGSGGGWRD